MNNPGFIAAIARRYPVATYCVMAMGITWGLKYLYALARADGEIPAFNFTLIGQYGPSIAGVTLIALTEGTAGLRRIARSILNRHIGYRWLLLAFLFEPALFAGITIIYSVSGNVLPDAGIIHLLRGLPSFAGTFVTGLFFWGLSEEIGWRGWLFPILQRRMSPFSASLVLAIIITIWHIHPSSLPEIGTVKEGICLIGRYPEVVERLIISIPFVLVITWIYNNTGGSLLAMMIFHSASNTSYFWIDGMYGIVTTNFFRTSFLVALIVNTILFSTLVVRQQKKILP